MNLKTISLHLTTALKLFTILSDVKADHALNIAILHKINAHSSLCATLIYNFNADYLHFVLVTILNDILALLINIVLDYFLYGASGAAPIFFDR